MKRITAHRRFYIPTKSPPDGRQWQDFRIVVREDGQYEVELWYWPLGWAEMGGPFATIEEARDKVQYWKKYDEEQKREKAIKRRVVEQ